jgi:hypothetical protein
MIRALAIVLLLSGCASIGPYGYGRGTDPALYGVPDAVVVVRPPELYTRPEIDAINAEAACRALARNSLQAQRCGVRR